MILAILVILLVAALISLQMSDLLLFDFLLDFVNEAPLQFYISAIIIAGIILSIFLFKTKTLLKQKKEHHSLVELKHIEEIKTELTYAKKGFETDLDKLYKLIQERKKLTLSEVAKGFSIKKEKAEEWGRILKDSQLIDIHYPPVGEAELLWKKSMSTK